MSISSKLFSTQRYRVLFLLFPSLFSSESTCFFPPLSYSDGRSQNIQQTQQLLWIKFQHQSTHFVFFSLLYSASSSSSSRSVHLDEEIKNQVSCNFLTPFLALILASSLDQRYDDSPRDLYRTLKVFNFTFFVSIVWFCIQFQIILGVWLNLWFSFLLSQSLVDFWN